HIIQHLHRNFYPQSNSSFLSWIIQRSNRFPHLLKKIIDKVDSNKIDFTSEMKSTLMVYPSPINYLELLLISNPSLLPFVIEKIGREKLNLDNITTLR